MAGRAKRAGAAERDAVTKWAKARGAEPVTFRAPVGEDGRLAQCAAWRAPEADWPMVEKMRARGQLTGRAYQNAAALLRCWAESGLAAGGGSTLEPRDRAPLAPSARHRPAEDDWHRAMREIGPDGARLVAGLVCGDAHPGWRLPDCRRALEGLDWVARDWPGEPWAEDGGDA